MEQERRYTFTTIDKDVVEKMLMLATSRTDEALNDRFGISYNTWRKIIAGKPVRSSMAARLMKRIDSIDGRAVESK